MKTKNPTSSRRPAKYLRRGKVQAVIWAKSGRKGPVFQVSFWRPFLTEDGLGGSSDSFRKAELIDLVLVIAEAGLWMEANGLNGIKNGQDEDGSQHEPSSEDEEDSVEDLAC